jgi:prepilin-type N-terminal cleavage/methylation domain-containing protein
MLNHKGFTLVEMMIAIFLVSITLTLYLSLQVQLLHFKKLNNEEKIGIYLAEHIQSMVLAEIRPFDLQDAYITMDLYGHMIEDGQYMIQYEKRYLVIIDTYSGQIIFEGDI